MNAAVNNSKIENDDTTPKMQHDKFLKGNVVYLRVPDIDADIFHGEWHNWFNDPVTTRYLTHGVFPISRAQQASYISDAISKRDNLILCVVAIESNKHVGVISLNNIDLLNRIAEIRIVMGPNRIAGVPALEAMALLIKHAFDRLNITTLYAGQHEGLWKWINVLSHIGFRINGFQQNAGYRNGKAHGIYFTSISAANFYELEQARGGNILNLSISELLQNRSRCNPLKDFQSALDALNEEWQMKINETNVPHD